MTFLLSRHAGEEMLRRQIPAAWLDALLSAPEQLIPQSAGTEIHQSRFTAPDGKLFLVRAVIATE